MLRLWKMPCINRSLCKHEHSFVPSLTNLSPIVLFLCIVAHGYSSRQEGREPELYAMCYSMEIMWSRRVHFHDNIILRLLWVMLTRHSPSLQKLFFHFRKSSRLRERHQRMDCAFIVQWPGVSAKKATPL